MKMECGARIRFKHDLHEEATGDHPLFVMARKGEGGTFIEERSSEGMEYTCLVRWDGWDAPFWCAPSEFEEGK